MSPETADKLIWLGKVFQLLAAIILTPEIIGPDRFEKLESFVESEDFSRRTGCTFGLAVILIAMIQILALLAVGTIRLLLQIPYPVFDTFLSMLVLIALLIAVFFPRLGDDTEEALWRLVESALIKFAAYLRGVSLFRTVAIATAIALFFFGVGLELVLEWPF